MDTRPKALDLFCKAGGATKGLQRAGFHVTGVDIEPQPRYCGGAFIQADALTFDLSGYDFIWASPPCHAGTRGLSNTGASTKRSRIDLIPKIRPRLIASGLPYIIENVEGSSLVNAVLLCGATFGLRTLRHRLFESNLLLLVPPHSPHLGTLYNGEYVAVYNGKWKSSGSRYPIPKENTTARAWSVAMGIDWMIKEELAQAIPPAYSEFLGRQVMSYLMRLKEDAA